MKNVFDNFQREADDFGGYYRAINPSHKNKEQHIILAHISYDPPQTNVSSDVTIIQGENQIIKDKVAYWNPQTREDWMLRVIPDIIIKIKEFNKQPQSEKI